ncbi:PLP-dependent transferase [Apiospora arundinis]|uniref:PLP-dependent transferase n=1 Tax=Apiospora arundinis TaxID=335852 RepID=A0ABR2JCG9_9PEZI
MTLVRSRIRHPSSSSRTTPPLALHIPISTLTPPTTTTSITLASAVVTTANAANAATAAHTRRSSTATSATAATSVGGTSTTTPTTTAGTTTGTQRRRLFSFTTHSSSRNFFNNNTNQNDNGNDANMSPSNVGGIGLVAEEVHLGKQAPEPLTLAGIRARRAKAGKLDAPTASYSDSDMFKAPQSFDKPKAKRWDHLLSAESAARKPCVLKQAAKHLKKPGLVSLGGGLPSAENFPFESLSMQVPTPAGGFSHTSNLKQVTIGKHDVRDTEDGVLDLSIALNYGQSIGSAQLLRWVTEHTELVHNPPYADWRCALTIGSTGSLEAAYRMFGDRTRGDGILTEEYSFSTALETAAPLGLRVFGIPMDEQGLLPDKMDELLTNWDPEARGGARRPRVLYTVPSGQNPTGATQSEQRRREVYEVCRKHDVFIFEDEPYYFLQMQPYQKGGASKGGSNGVSTTRTQQISSSTTTSTLSITPNGASSAPSGEAVDDDGDVEAFMRTLIPSLLSIDTDGRVMRHDSFSKVVVPGSRVGWVTASEQVVERYIRHAECCSQGPSGFSQAVLYKLLDEEWGHAGYLRWLMHLRDEYSARRDAILGACEKYLPGEVVSWTPPAAGMFLWLKVDHTRHPLAATKSLLELEEEIFDSGIDKGVLACRGSWFRAEHDKPLSGLFFRTTYAAASEEQMAVAIERFGEAVRGSFGI